MLPLQQTDICIATQKRNINELLQFIGFVFFTRRRTKKKVYKNSTRRTYHCWSESIILSLVDLQEGQLNPQYYYVSNFNKHVNKKD